MNQYGAYYPRVGGGFAKVPDIIMPINAVGIKAQLTETPFSTMYCNVTVPRYNSEWQSTLTMTVAVMKPHNVAAEPAELSRLTAMIQNQFDRFEKEGPRS